MNASLNNVFYIQRSARSLSTFFVTIPLDCLLLISRMKMRVAEIKKREKQKRNARKQERRKKLYDLVTKP